DFREMSPTDVKMAYDDLKCQFTAATPADMRRDDPENQQWRNAMMAALLGDPSEKMAEEILQGLSPEYFMQLEWLPGCRIEKGRSFAIRFSRSRRNAIRRRTCAIRARRISFSILLWSMAISST